MSERPWWWTDDDEATYRDAQYHEAVENGYRHRLDGRTCYCGEADVPHVHRGGEVRTLGYDRDCRARLTDG